MLYVVERRDGGVSLQTVLSDNAFCPDFLRFERETESSVIDLEASPACKKCVLLLGEWEIMEMMASLRHSQMIVVHNHQIRQGSLYRLCVILRDDQVVIVLRAYLRVTFLACEVSLHFVRLTLIIRVTTILIV